jgi:hypothetical protein
MKGSARPAGYSGTPLAKKLGVAEGATVLGINLPEGYAELVAPLPPRVSITDRPGAGVSLAHVFVVGKEELARQLSTLRGSLAPATPVWVSWPKKASKRPTTVSEDVIREIALPLGYVDVKVCAVSEVWSGLKLVVRRELR